MTVKLGTFETRLATPVEEGGINLRAAAASDSGEFEGFLCRFNVTDSYGTRFLPGCFERGGLDEALYALLFMHDPMLPAATFHAEERGDEGLWIEGAYDQTQLGQDCRVRAKSGSASGLSVGFVWLDTDPDDENAIASARVVEGSQITARMASVPGSQISAVRSGWAGQDAIVAGSEKSASDVDVLRRAAARAKLLAL